MIPWEYKCEGALKKKATKYQDLIQQCRDKEWQACLFLVEVGCRGVLVQSMVKRFTALGKAAKEKKTAAHRLPEVAKIASCWLFNKWDELS